MANVNDCYRLLKEINSRLDLTEELLKVIAVNDLIDELNDIETKDSSVELCENTKKIFDDYGIAVIKKEEFCGNTVLYLKSEYPWQIKNIINIRNEINNAAENLIPVFVFERVYGKQKKRLEQEKISYYIADKQLHIYG